MFTLGSLGDERSFEDFVLVAGVGDGVHLLAVDGLLSVEVAFGGGSASTSGDGLGLLGLGEAAEEGVVKELAGVGGVAVWVVGAVVALAAVDIGASIIRLCCAWLIGVLVESVVAADGYLSSLSCWRPRILSGLRKPTVSPIAASKCLRQSSSWRAIPRPILILACSAVLRLLSFLQIFERFCLINRRAHDLIFIIFSSLRLNCLVLHVRFLVLQRIQALFAVVAHLLDHQEILVELLERPSAIS